MQENSGRFFGPWKEGARGDGIFYAEDEEKAATRALWEECFPEDSREFTDYYYREKVKKNRILTAREGDELLSMVHRNPYKLRFRKQVWQADYLVGVATKESRRGEGHMRRLLGRCLRDMRREGMPFTFLMPAAERIYRPFGFRFVFDQPKFVLTEEGEAQLKSVLVERNERDLRRAADFMEGWLDKRYSLYALRDPVYVDGLIGELESENGALCFLFRDDELAGLQAHWGLQKRGQRLLYAEDRWVKRAGEKPAIMARITHLEEFLAAISLAGPGELLLDLSIRDVLIPENNGSFVWHLTEQGSALIREEEGALKAAGIRPRLEADIGDFTSWVFGCRCARELWPALSGSVYEALEKVEAAGGLFLDEIV